MTRWIFTTRALNPDGRGTWETGIRPAYYKVLQQSGDAATLARIAIAKDVVESPNRIVKGWDRDETDRCYVYIGNPGQDYRSATIELPAPPKMVFAVFVLPDGIWDLWAWRPVDDNNPSGANGVKGEVIWTAPTTT
jgi:hypothetical protein